MFTVIIGKRDLVIVLVVCTNTLRQYIKKKTAKHVRSHAVSSLIVALGREKKLKVFTLL